MTGQAQMISMEATRLRAIKPSPSITISTAAKAMRALGTPIIDLSLGEPDFDTPDNIIEAAYRAMKRGETRYTAPDGTPALKDAAVEKFRRENLLSFTRDNISCANGAKQVIYNALTATLEAGDEVICSAPYWVSYTDMTLLAGGTPRIVECTADEGFKLTPTALERAITPATRWLFLNSPSNPTGAIYSRQELAALGEVLRKYPRVLILSDEIYEHIHFADQLPTSFAAACPALAHRTVIVNGVSKTYAMTGWRIGYAAAPVDLARIMGKIQSQSTSNPSSISQAAAVEALGGPQDFVSRMRATYLARRNRAVAELRGIRGIEVFEPQGAFYVFPNVAAFIGKKTPHGAVIADDSALARYLLEVGKVACVQGAAFGSSPYLRLSYTLAEGELTRAIVQIHDALDALL
jgi:aspartate aminotransferase